MKDSKSILEHYKNEACLHKGDGTSTIKDIKTRQLEMDTLLSYIKHDMNILEIGCGNGFVSQAMAEQFNINIDAIDFTQEMIDIAQKRKLENFKSTLNFSCQDILSFTTTKKYDIIFTERCIQNLLNWSEQQKACLNIINALKLDGYFIMLESFLGSLNNLNLARRELNLSDIDQPWHNCYFDENETVSFFEQNGCHYIDQNNFLSGYYFWSRAIYPSLLKDGSKANSSSILNEYFCNMPPHGDFSPIKILRFQKHKTI